MDFEMVYDFIAIVDFRTDDICAEKPAFCISAFSLLTWTIFLTLLSREAIILVCREKVAM